MAVSYSRLSKLWINKGITKTETWEKAGISTSLLSKMGKNETVSMTTLTQFAAVGE